MESAFEVKNLTRSFGDVTALDNVSVCVPGPSVVGLIGRNGSGKTTLLRHVFGLYLPTSGQCTTLGCPSDKLGSDELSRIGVVHQENRFLEWMKVEQQLRYVSTFYKHWDRDLEQRLLDELELDPSARVGDAFPRERPETGHHSGRLSPAGPADPGRAVSGLDPITREQFLRFLLELLQQGAKTIVISSHVLHDIEKVINRVICLDRGRIRADASLDDLQERFAEWRVTARDGRLPAHFEEDFVVSREGDSRQARLLVKGASDNLNAFKSKYGADVVSSPLNLEQMFPLLLQEAE